MTFNDLIETIKNLSIEEKQEIQILLQQYLREEHRNKIYNNFQMSLVEEKEGKLKFASNLEQLRQVIEMSFSSSYF
jgi:hypothetical protein